MKKYLIFLFAIAAFTTQAQSNKFYVKSIQVKDTIILKQQRVTGFTTNLIGADSLSNLKLPTAKAVNDFVKSKLSPVYTAGNGIALIGNQFKLGGTLTENTTVNAGKKTLRVTNANSFEVYDSLGNLTFISSRTNVAGSSGISGQSTDGQKSAGIAVIGGVFGLVNIQAVTGSASSTIEVRGDSIAIAPYNGRMRITSMESETDTTTSKPMVYDTDKKRWKYLQYWPSGSSSDTRPYYSFVAKLDASYSLTPVMTVIENTFGSSFTFTRTGPGEYFIQNTSNPFTNNKTVVIIGVPMMGDVKIFSNEGANDTGNIFIYAANGTTGITEDYLLNNVIEIRVYK